MQFFNSIEKQQQMMLQGLSRLCLLNLPSPVKYLQEKLPNKSKLAFYFTAYGKVNELIQDCINCAIQSLIQENGGLIWCEQDYVALLQNLRGKLNERTELIANKIEKILLMNVAVNKKLKGAIDIKYICALSDIKQQLNQLIYKGFVTVTTLTKLVVAEKNIDMAMNSSGLRAIGSVLLPFYLTKLRKDLFTKWISPALLLEQEK